MTRLDDMTVSNSNDASTLTYAINDQVERRSSHQRVRILQSDAFIFLTVLQAVYTRVNFPFQPRSMPTHKGL